MGTNSIPIGAAGDVYHYLSSIIRSDGLLDLTGGALTSGQGLIAQIQGPHGPIIGAYVKEVESAALVGATANVGTNFIPAGSCPLFISLYNTVAVTLAAGTTYTAGDGTTADLFGVLLPLAAGDTLNLWKTLTSPKWYSTAVNLVLTGTGGAFTGGKVRAAMVYLSRGAQLS